MFCSVIVLLCNTGSVSLFTAGIPTVWSRGTSLWAFQVVLVAKNLPANAGDVRDAGSIPGFRKIPWRRAWHPTPVFLPGESHGQRSLVEYSNGVTKSWMQLSE